MQDFMKDRYGVDELTYILGLAGMVLALIGSIVNVQVLSWLAIAIIVLALLRAFSKNIAARRRENDAFKGAVSEVPGLNTLVDKLGAGTMGAAASRSAAGRPSNGRPRPTQSDVARAKRTAQRMWNERKTTKFLKCPNCGQILSVPKGKGRIRVTCPKCRTKVETKS